MKGKHMFTRLLIILISGSLISACSAITGGQAILSGEKTGYEMISVNALQEMMKEGDLTLINVHIPLEGSINGTDLEIPFDQIAEFLDILPEDKSENIVIYCRSGSMGDQAAAILAELGYTSVSNLEGGYIAWQAAGLPFGDPK